MGSLFGGSKSQSKQESVSYNKAYDDIRNTYNPVMNVGSGATSALSAMLGLGGDIAGQNAAFGNFLNNSGYQHVLNEGTRTVEGSQAARGMLSSGSTLRALQSLGQNTASSYLDQYLSRLAQMQQAGLAGGSLLANAGQYSTSSGTSNSSQNNGIGQALGTAMSIIAASDPAVKEDVVKIDEFDDGLGIYEFRYIWSDEKTVGVMADEVERLRPWALGPTICGYRTVNYGRL